MEFLTPEPDITDVILEQIDYLIDRARKGFATGAELARLLRVRDVLLEVFKKAA